MVSFALFSILLFLAFSADFISIDCGYSGSDYQDTITNLTFISDDTYVDTGIKNEISTLYNISSLSKQSLTVRSFPNGSRNCYTIPANKNGKYLLRATFLYGHYDNGSSMMENNNSFMFGLHLGINSWVNVSIQDSFVSYPFEAITAAPTNFLSVCLIDMNHGTPFISSLEMRPFDSFLYPVVSSDKTLALSFRYNMGPTDDKIIRYPDDNYDRIWRSYNYSSRGWDRFPTSRVPFKYLNNDSFHVPPSVLETAVQENQDFISLSWAPDKSLASPNYYLILHFCELWDNSTARTTIDIVYNGGQLSSNNITITYLVAASVYSISSISGLQSYYFLLKSDATSTYVPLLNAVEVYYNLSMSNAVTDYSDASALKDIKRAYRITKTSWQGDPCAPSRYIWDRIGCNSVNNTLRITSIDLSSSNLTGPISNSFSALTELVFLDLSYNGFNETIPNFLGSLTSLKVLNISGNCFSGRIPNNLLSKSGFILRYESYDSACTNGSSTTSRNLALIIVIPSLLGAIFLIGIFFFIWRKMKKPRDLTIQNARNSTREVPLEPILQESPVKNGNYEDEIQITEIRKFSYMEVEKLTENFARFIGKGGFGPVYHGYLEDKREVAVKMRADSSTHGMKEFLAEVGYLAKVYHRNLVRLVGYCREEKHLGLVYEFMPQGCLTDHLISPRAVMKALNWRQRLQIALDAAQGLDYLHTGCDAPIIHRDVKSHNILLDNNLRAKIADFGLSRAFLDHKQTHMSTLPAGTPGYMDIEYHRTGRLTQKSDVYSFGIVLLELVTGERPVDLDKGHIRGRVNEMIMRGIIDNIIDEKLGGDYEIKSVWKVVDIAMQCTADSSKQRPAMDAVVVQLKESLALEMTHETRTSSNPSTNSYPYTASSTLPESFDPAPR